jgi:hypothetical protein
MASPSPFLREIIQLWNGSKPVPWQCDANGAAAVTPRVGGSPLGYEQINPTTATALTVPTGATVAVIQAEAYQVRMRDDGTNPTASVGFLIPTGAGGEMIYTGDLASVKLIDTSAGASTVNVLYY